MNNLANNSVVTFGCRLNIFESEIIRENLAASGLENVVIFNTCTVTKAAEHEAIHAIKRLKKEKPDCKIIVTGCAVQTNSEKFAEMTEIDKILGNEEKLHPENYKLDGRRLLVNDIMSIKETASHIVKQFKEHSRAFIQVQNGCDHRCTFCIIPFGRGNSRSVPIGTLVTQVKNLLVSGYKEIVFTGVDVTSYGPDLPGNPTFSQMIRRLLSLVPDLQRLRLSSIDVAEIDDDLFELMAYEKRLMPHFHISLQSGDNMILKRMKRRHQREDVIEFCHRLREIRSDVSYGADIIAGFPTETEEMFKNTNKLITEADLQYLHIFPYSEREGTPAARMPQVEKHVRKERAAILRKSGEKNLTKFFNKFENTKAKVLIEKNNRGHTENFIPVRVLQDIKEGSIVEVTLTKVDGKVMLGSIDK